MTQHHDFGAFGVSLEHIIIYFRCCTRRVRSDIRGVARLTLLPLFKEAKAMGVVIQGEDKKIYLSVAYYDDCLEVIRVGHLRDMVKVFL